MQSNSNLARFKSIYLKNTPSYTVALKETTWPTLQDDEL